MKDTEIKLIENILKNHNIKNLNELSARLNEIDNDKKIIRGLQKAVTQRDKRISMNADKITMLKTKTNKTAIEIKNTKSLALNDKFSLLNEIKLKDHRIAVLERALKLACEPRDDWGGKEYSEPYTNYYDYFIDQAEKELKDEKLQY